MTAIFAIARRELGGYFSSVIGWIVLVAFTFLAGFFFSAMLIGYAAQPPGGAPEENVTEMMIQGIFGNLSVITLLMMPLVTMGIIAADRRERSIELLLTSPISSWQIVFGKFLGGMAFALAMVAMTFEIPAALFSLGSPDTGVFYATYGGFLVLMGVFVAVGMFASSLSDNQLISAVIAFGILLAAWIVGWFATIPGEGALKATIEHIALLNHFEQLSKGVVHTNDIVYFVSVIVFFLFATTQRVEALRWR